MMQTSTLSDLPGGAITLDRNADVPMRDGATLRANVFRPAQDGRFPVLMTFGPYGKDVHLKNVMAGAVYDGLRQRFPQIFEHTTGAYMGFETPDPEMWVRHGYCIMKVDSRGAGKSPGRLDVNSPQEFQDFYDAIEWAAAQPWCSGKVGLLGISYYAASQWNVAALQPPHLAAILPWQGTPDFYRDRTRQGGIFGSGFVGRWLRQSVYNNQHANPDSNFFDLFTGERNTGPDSLPAEQLAANRADYYANILAHPLLDEWYRARSPRFDRIALPALVVANLGGLGLHLRGTVEGFARIASPDKWLKLQSGPYFATFFVPENVAVQRRFFDRYLKDLDNGWEQEPRVQVELRGDHDRVERTLSATAWPLPQTQWTRLFLDAHTLRLQPTPPDSRATVSYDAMGDGVTFTTGALEAPLLLAGPASARLHVSSSLPDMDLFLTVRAFDPDGRELTWVSSTEPRSPVTQGWLRVTQRKTDPALSTDHQPVHTHDEIQPLVPDQISAIDVEIWPTSLSLPAGYRLDVLLQGRDFERAGTPGDQRGSGWFLHNDPVDRPPNRFSGVHIIHTGPDTASSVLLPVVAS